MFAEKLGRAEHQSLLTRVKQEKGDRVHSLIPKSGNFLPAFRQIRFGVRLVNAEISNENYENTAEGKCELLHNLKTMWIKADHVFVDKTGANPKRNITRY